MFSFQPNTNKSGSNRASGFKAIGSHQQHQPATITTKRIKKGNKNHKSRDFRFSVWSLFNPTRPILKKKKKILHLWRENWLSYLFFKNIQHYFCFEIIMYCVSVLKFDFLKIEFQKNRALNKFQSSNGCSSNVVKTYLELDNHKIKFYGKLDFLKIEFQNKDMMLNSFKIRIVY